MTFPHLLIRASAGSGKTHQLTNRYLALLATGVEPDAILATTFTRKAAGEILARILTRLANAAGDRAAAAQLAEQIDADSYAQPEFVKLLRGLLNALHRVRISTLDSFYIALARSFSFELDLPAGWSICEEADDSRQWNDALESLLLSRQAGGTLFGLYQRLTQGKTKRGVHAELFGIVKDLYEIQQQSQPETWRSLTAPTPLSDDKFQALVVKIAGFDLSANKTMTKPRDQDLERIRAEDWAAALKTGLLAKVAGGNNVYFKKPIPEGLVELYRDLLNHVVSRALQPIAEQTAATREFLDGFHKELWALKSARGVLRFNEVTQALVRAFAAGTLRSAGIGFRLDGDVRHLLLDEFQDTSLPQWRVLEALARHLTAGPGDRTRSFFCVGDVKQAIYAWRGGLSAIFTALPKALGSLQMEPLFESRRSALPIIDVVNAVFGGIGSFADDEKRSAGLTAWAGWFDKHTTAKESTPGYVCLQTGPEQHDGESVGDLRGRHCAYVAGEIKKLTVSAPGHSIGVLCRTNDTIARLIFELRRLGVDASEEGGSPLVDSPAVELILSLFSLADHPGHSVAWFHLKNSPLSEELADAGYREAYSARLRGELLRLGYGPFVYRWAQRIAAACDRRDLSRLQQLIDMAYAFQARSSLRPGEFVDWVHEQRVPDPSSAAVRVMTIHAAKGLQFDIAVLPELGTKLLGRAPAFVVARDADGLEPTVVCRYASAAVQNIMPREVQQAFDADCRVRVEESLSMLYVAMTRPVHALYMFMPGKYKKAPADAWFRVLKNALAMDAAWTPETKLYEHGDAQWAAKSGVRPTPTAVGREPPSTIVFQSPGSVRRRGLEFTSPSRQEGGGQLRARQLFELSTGTGTAAGTVYHAWFEQIEWLESGAPDDAVLRQVAKRLSAELPAAAPPPLDVLLQSFRRYLAQPAIKAALHRAAYGDPKQTGFPAQLRKIWQPAFRAARVERERPFVYAIDGKLWNGSLDRIVWITDGQRTVAADIIDFKTDQVETDKAIGERTEHYRPQIAAYRDVVARLANIDSAYVAARLLFTEAGRVVDI